LFHASPDLLQAAMMVQKYFRTLDHGFNQELTDCSNAINKAIDKAILPATRYDHDCEACTFLGQYNQYDLYYCHSEPTVIARYANEGAAYTSGLSSDHHALIEAKKRASEKGFI
jgi:hypothetical protein